MPQSSTRNRKFVLAERPKGEPDDKTLRLEVEDLPIPGKGQMLLRNEYLSLDPYMRGRMSDAPSYAPPVEIGEVMVGGTVSQVVSSDREDFATDDWVVAFGGWQDYALSDGDWRNQYGKVPRESVLGTGRAGDAGPDRLGRVDPDWSAQSW